MKKTIILSIALLYLCIGISQGEEITDPLTLSREAHSLLDQYEGDAELLAEASRKFKQIYEANPKNEIALIGLARLLSLAAYKRNDIYDKEMLAIALAYINEAIKLNGQSFDAYYYGFYAYIHSNDLENARKFMALAKRIDSADPRNDWFPIEIARKQKNWSTLEDLAKGLIEKSTNKRDLYFANKYLARMYRAQGDYKLTSKHYLNAIDIRPESPWILVTYCDFLIEIKNYDEAIVYGEKALEFMDFEMGHHKLAEAYYRKGRQLFWGKKQYEQGNKNFELALKHEPDNAYALYGYGLNMYMEGYKNNDREKTIQSMAVFKKVLSIIPNHKGAKEQLDMLNAWYEKEKNRVTVCLHGEKIFQKERITNCLLGLALRSATLCYRQAPQLKR